MTFSPPIKKYMQWVYGAEKGNSRHWVYKTRGQSPFKTEENSHSLWMREKQQQETRENETRGGELWVMLYSFFIS